MVQRIKSYDINGLVRIVEACGFFGDSNKAYFPLSYMSENVPGKVMFAGTTYSNVDATDVYWMFQLDLPTVRGSYKLFIDALKINITDADTLDYLDRVNVYGNTDSSSDLLLDDDTNRTAAGSYVYPFTAVDCSSYANIVVWIRIVATDANDFDLLGIFLRCYYG